MRQPVERASAEAGSGLRVEHVVPNALSGYGSSYTSIRTMPLALFTLVALAE